MGLKYNEIMLVDSINTPNTLYLFRELKKGHEEITINFKGGEFLKSSKPLKLMERKMVDEKINKILVS